jgi:hypothetical protein
MEIASSLLILREGTLSAPLRNAEIFKSSCRFAVDHWTACDAGERTQVKVNSRD